MNKSVWTCKNDVKDTILNFFSKARFTSGTNEFEEEDEVTLNKLKNQ